MQLSALMKAKGISAQDMAKALNVSVRRVQGWMYTEREPSLTYLLGIAHVMGLSIDELVQQLLRTEK